MVSVYLRTLINSVLQHCGAPVYSCEHLLHIFVDNYQKKIGGEEETSQFEWNIFNFII